jgi:hypothetical protein
MHTNALLRLEQYCAEMPARLGAIPPALMTTRPAPDKWSPQEILGHLIDSAANNLQRFVRVQFEENPDIRYDQNQWNAHSYYLQADSTQLIECWTALNRHLAALLRRIPPEALGRRCHTGGAEPVTLAWLIADYVAHLEHHFRQMGLR